ncbi:MAG: hypothetical protein EBZ48_16495 [Proteobacteria bacterium]|nr:hypothetical protein [Pseudomonadota bacterium]
MNKLSTRPYRSGAPLIHRVATVFFVVITSFCTAHGQSTDDAEAKLYLEIAADPSDTPVVRMNAIKRLAPHLKDSVPVRTEFIRLLADEETDYSVRNLAIESLVPYLGLAEVRKVFDALATAFEGPFKDTARQAIIAHTATHSATASDVELLLEQIKIADVTDEQFKTAVQGLYDSKEKTARPKLAIAIAAFLKEDIFGVSSSVFIRVV